MSTATASTSLRPPPSPPPPQLAGSLRQWCWGIPAHSPPRRAFHAHRRRRNTLLRAAVKGPEESFKKTIEVDRLIDMLREANPRELKHGGEPSLKILQLDLIVVENILAFSEGFWLRLAARIDLCKSDDDKKDYEELAENIMNIVDRVVHKTDEKIEQSTDVLKAIISPVMHEGEEAMWPPRNPEALELMEKVKNLEHLAVYLGIGQPSIWMKPMCQFSLAPKFTGRDGVQQQVQQVTDNGIGAGKSQILLWLRQEIGASGGVPPVLVGGRHKLVIPSVLAYRPELAGFFSVNSGCTGPIFASLKTIPTARKILDRDSVQKNPTLEISNREKAGQLDESFLSEVNAQLRQAKDAADKPGLLVMLQKVLQLYASNFLRKRSYAYKGGEVVVPEKFLESIIEAPESEWNKLLLDGLTVGKGDVSPEELHAVTKKRIERILIRTEGGSYQQRVLVEYIKEIQARAEEIVNRLQGPAV